MRRELTELHWIGYSTESIWVRRFKSSTSIPIINSQTCGPKAVSTRDEWNNLFNLFTIMSNHIFSQPFLSNGKQAVMSKKVAGSCFIWFANGESEIKIVQSCVSQSRGVPGLKLCQPGLGNHCWKHVKRFGVGLSRDVRETKSKMILNILNRAIAQPASGKPMLVGLVFLVRVVKVEWVDRIPAAFLTNMHLGNRC